MKYRYEAYNQNRIISAANITATHPIQIVNLVTVTFPDVTRVHILKETGERIVYIINGKFVTLFKKVFRTLNSDEIKLVFSGELMFGSMVDG